MKHATAQDSHRRRVVLLETDERAGLVASLAAACAAQGVSLEITTGPGHVVITFEADAATADHLWPALRQVPGVQGLHAYAVAQG
jgi:hypothetical protein